MKTHRWWLALMATLLTPWFGPHVDRYLPVGWVVLKAGGDAPDPAFWVIAGVLLCVAYAAWFALLSVIAVVVARGHGNRDKSKVHSADDG